MIKLENVMLYFFPVICLFMSTNLLETIQKQECFPGSTYTVESVEGFIFNHIIVCCQEKES